MAQLRLLGLAGGARGREVLVELTSWPTDRRTGGGGGAEVARAGVGGADFGWKTWGETGGKRSGVSF